MSAIRAWQGSSFIGVQPVGKSDRSRHEGDYDSHAEFALGLPLDVVVWRHRDGALKIASARQRKCLALGIMLGISVIGDERAGRREGEKNFTFLLLL